jgi:hypothetical protein
VANYHSSLADNHYNLAVLYQGIGRAKEAEAGYKKVLAIRKNLVERHPDVPEYQRKWLDQSLA